MSGIYIKEVQMTIGSLSVSKVYLKWVVCIKYQRGVYNRQNLLLLDVKKAKYHMADQFEAC